MIDVYVALFLALCSVVENLRYFLLIDYNQSC